jgi:hypothetical protein
MVAAQSLSHSHTTAPSWRTRGAILRDMESITSVGDWCPTFDSERDILTATARGNQGAYTLVLYHGAVSLILARDRGDIDLSTLVRDEDVGLKIREIACSLRSGSREQNKILERLPDLTTKPISYVASRDCWRASSGAGASYLYFEEGAASVQITCFPGGGNSPLYQVKIQPSPDHPWIDITENVRSVPRYNQAVQLLLQTPIS